MVAFNRTASNWGRLLTAFVCMAVVVLGVLPGQVAADPSPPEERYAAIVADADTGEILYARHADERRFPASITKVMTLYLVFEALESGRIDKDDMITVSANAASQPPSKLGIAAGRKISVDDAIRSLAVRSANDMAVALAEHVGGSEARFAEQMTRKARDLGMAETRYMNPHGLPNRQHVSSARDIAILSIAVRRDFPQYYSYFGQRRWTWEGRTYNNTNGLLHYMQGVDGLKTGFTRASGYNLTTSATRNGKHLVAVVLGGRSTQTRNSHVAELLETGFKAVRMRADGGSVEQAGQLFPAASDNTPRVLRVSLSAPSPDAGRAVERPTGKRGDWRIQVGAFRDSEVASEWLGQVGRRFREQIGDTEGMIVPSAAGWHQARYVGFAREEASAACQALEAARVPCLVVSPG